jgi:hypothetical protein
VSLALVCGTLCAALACGDKTGPTGPSGSVIPQTLTISGRTTLSQPGDTSQLNAIALFSDGTKKDVTADASWFGGVSVTDGRPVATVSRGLLTAVEFGQANFTVNYSLTHALVPVRVAPEGMFFLSGHVTESGFAVPQATVEAVSLSGTLSAITNADGVYVVPAAGDVTLRVGKDGYQQETRRLTVGQDGEIDVELRRTNAPGDIRGIWSLTVVASPSCTLPPDMMQRTYSARIDETAKGITVDLSAAGSHGDGWDKWGFTGTRDATTLRFILGDPTSGYDTTENIDSSKSIWYVGTAVGPAADRKVSAVFSGKVFLWASGTTVECPADDHRLEFVR